MIPSVTFLTRPFSALIPTEITSKGSPQLYSRQPQANCSILSNTTREALPPTSQFLYLKLSVNSRSKRAMGFKSKRAMCQSQGFRVMTTGAVGREAHQSGSWGKGSSQEEWSCPAGADTYLEKQSLL